MEFACQVHKTLVNANQFRKDLNKPCFILILDVKNMMKMANLETFILESKTEFYWVPFTWTPESTGPELGEEFQLLAVVEAVDNHNAGTLVDKITVVEMMQFLEEDSKTEFGSAYVMKLTGKNRVVRVARL